MRAYGPQGMIDSRTTRADPESSDRTAASIAKRLRQSRPQSDGASGSAPGAGRGIAHRPLARSALPEHSDQSVARWRDRAASDTPCSWPRCAARYLPRSTVWLRAAPPRPAAIAQPPVEGGPDATAPRLLSTMNFHEARGRRSYRLVGSKSRYDRRQIWVGHVGERHQGSRPLGASDLTACRSKRKSQPLDRLTTLHDERRSEGRPMVTSPVGSEVRDSTRAVTPQEDRHRGRCRQRPSAPSPVAARGGVGALIGGGAGAAMPSAARRNSGATAVVAFAAPLARHHSGTGRDSRHPESDGY